MLVKLFDDVALMNQLQKEAVKVLHSTDKVPAIKKILTIHDIIALNLTIEQNFKPYKNNPPWDIPSIKELNSNRIELVVFHVYDFHPPKILLHFDAKIKKLLQTIQLQSQVAFEL